LSLVSRFKAAPVSGSCTDESLNTNDSSSIMSTAHFNALAASFGALLLWDVRGVLRLVRATELRYADRQSGLVVGLSRYVAWEA